MSPRFHYWAFRMWRWVVWWRLLLVCIGVFTLASNTSAQAASSSSIPDTDFQSWNELDLKTRFVPALDVTWIARVRFSVNLPNPSEYLFGSDWNISVNRHLVITPSWYYFANRSSSALMKSGQSPVFGFTPLLSRRKWTISDRNRFCGRFGANGIGPSWDYRSRPQVEYQLGESQHQQSVFLWDEETYYSSYHGWTRNRMSAGIRRVLQKRVITDLYYQREDDSVGTPNHINTVAVLIEMRLR